jgi:hypothetical protein
MPPMDDMLAAHSADLTPGLRTARAELTELLGAVNDAIEAPETVSADALTRLLRNRAFTLRRLAAAVDAGMPPEAQPAA